MKYKIIILFFCFLSFYEMTSQTTSFFNDYHKLSFQFGVSRYYGAETSNLPSGLIYKFNNFTSPHFGFYYDILQSESFNFKIGISTLLIREIDEIFIDEAQIPNGNRDFARITELVIDGAWRFNLPIITEYLLDTNFGKMSLNSSFITGYHQEFGISEASYGVRVPESQEFTEFNSTYSRSAAPWYFNAQLGIGLYFPFEKWMLRTNLYYNFALQNLYEGNFTFSNLAQSPDTSGNFSFRGDSFGLELSIYLKKKKD